MKLLIHYTDFADIEGWRYLVWNATADFLEVDKYEITLKVLSEDEFVVRWKNPGEELEPPVLKFLDREIRFLLNKAETKQSRADMEARVRMATLLINLSFLSVVTANFLYMLCKDFQFIRVP